MTGRRCCEPTGARARDRDTLVRAHPGTVRDWGRERAVLREREAMSCHSVPFVTSLLGPPNVR